MEWRDRAIVIGVRAHGESSAILHVLTASRGRHLGLVHGGRSRRMRPSLQAGNSVDVAWRARIEDQLGTFTVEPRTLRAARLLDSALALHALNHLCALAHLLPEREPHEPLHDQLAAILDHLEDRTATPAAIVRFELSLLQDLGFGLDLATCAATGTRDDLAYVSPKSGRAVCRSAGEPYRDRLLVLPDFLRDDPDHVGPEDLADGFRLAEHFLLRDVFTPRGLAMPDARQAYLRTLATVR